MCDVPRLLLGAEGVVNEAEGGKVKTAREDNRRENKQVPGDRIDDVPPSPLISFYRTSLFD